MRSAPPCQGAPLWMEPNSIEGIGFLGIFPRRRDSGVSMSEDGQDEAAEDAKRRYLLTRFWQSAREFWRGADKRTAWFLTGALLVTIAVQLVIQYQLTVWNRTIFD